MPEKRLTHFSLFSGIGGIDIAAEWAGFETVGQCEIDDYAARVLEKNFPNTPRWRDIRDVTAKSFRERTGLQSLTLLSGGFPCQPHSLAGKRKASADERDLWGEFARVIREIRPKWVLGENVRGLLSSESGRFFGRILRDMDEMGYNVGWCCYGASEVGALHRRERVFIVANSSCVGCGGVFKDKQKRRTDEHMEIREFEAFRKISSQQEDNTLFDMARKIPEPVSGILRNDDGLSNGLERLRCLGNAVVPQQVYPILEALAETEKRVMIYRIIRSKANDGE